MNSRALGIDIGTTFIKAVVVTSAGEVISRRQEQTTDWKQQSATLVQQFEREFGPIPAIGVCGPGIRSPDGRYISWMIGSMADLANFDFTTHLKRVRASSPSPSTLGEGWGGGRVAQNPAPLKLQAEPPPYPSPGVPGEGKEEVRVPVLNDALAALLAESWIGTATGIKDAVLLTLGTGIGGAIMSDGRLIRGHTGRAGHVGHITVDAFGPLDICNTPGSIENAIGNHTIVSRSGGRFSSTEELVAAYESGDAQARDIWLGSIRKLAATIASIINIVDPQRIILGGGMIRAGESLFAPLRAELDRVEWRPFGTGVEIVPAELGEWAGAIGSAYNALQANEP
jgi:glucokinase